MENRDRNIKDLLSPVFTDAKTSKTFPEDAGSRFRKPKIEFDLYDANIFHKELKRAYRAASDAVSCANDVARRSSEASQKAYAALATFEVEMQCLQEKYDIKDFSDFVTLENDDDKEGA